MSTDLASRASDVPDRLAVVLARLDAYPRSVPELLEVMPELICEMVHVLRVECGPGTGRRDPDVVNAFTAGLQSALARCVLRDQILITRERLQQLATELRAVPAGPTSVAGRGSQLLPAESRDAAPTPYGLPATLTRRELEVLGLMADGCTNAVIAERLMIADGTAKKHVVRVLRKLGAANRSEAVSRWFRAGGEVRSSATQ
jgi:DNA-binding CsgD family transcriptional regulator